MRTLSIKRLLSKTVINHGPLHICRKNYVRQSRYCGHFSTFFLQFFSKLDKCTPNFIPVRLKSKYNSANSLKTAFQGYQRKKLTTSALEFEKWSNHKVKALFIVLNTLKSPYNHI